MDQNTVKRIETCPAEGIFFKEETIEKHNISPATEGCVINVYDDVKYQEVLGFGGSFTESSAYLYSLLSEEDKKRFLKLYFDTENGIAYNFGRTHINSCDFSLSVYADVEEGDKTLETFNLEREKQYIIPFLKDAIAYSNQEIVLFASPWSPPAYMKDNNNMVRGGKLLEEYKSLWGHYYAKYVKAMANEGVKVHAITIQNEPHVSQPWESCRYSSKDEADFIADYLIDALDEEGLSDLKIMIWDHNKERVYDRTKKMFENPRVKERVWAVAHHWYTGTHFDALRLVHEQFNVPLVSSEFCGPITGDAASLAERYGVEICGNFNNYDIASCDWNMLLNENGGPFHNRSSKTVEEVFEIKDLGCYAPILYHTEKKELIVTPIYYYIGHFSKFVRRGAVRVATTKYSEALHVCAFVNPDGTKVCILINTAGCDMKANVRLDCGCTNTVLKAHSIVTLIF